MSLIDRIMIFEEDVDSFLLRYLLNELDSEDRKKVEECKRGKSSVLSGLSKNSFGVALDGEIEKGRRELYSI